MPFKSLNHILGVVENQPGWEAQHLFKRLLEFWTEAVGTAASPHSRPVSIQRSVVWVATSSSAWSQNLTFERHQILRKLNSHLSIQLVDMRFSTAHWQNNVSSPQPSSTSWKDHPSCILQESPVTTAPEALDSKDPKAAFQHWALVMQARSQNLPLCPQCQCHTPPGELQRWNVCALCATKQWQRD